MPTNTTTRVAIAFVTLLTMRWASANPAHDILSGISEGNRSIALAGLCSHGGEQSTSASRTL